MGKGASMKTHREYIRKRTFATKRETKTNKSCAWDSFWRMATCQWSASPPVQPINSRIVYTQSRARLHAVQPHTHTRNRIYPFIYYCHGYDCRALMDQPPHRPQMLIIYLVSINAGSSSTSGICGFCLMPKLMRINSARTIMPKRPSMEWLLCIVVHDWQMRARTQHVCLPVKVIIYIHIPIVGKCNGTNIIDE